MKTNDALFFADPVDPRLEARALALEVICRLLLWMADAPTIEDRGLRTSIALYCIRPDLIDGDTMEKIGDATGRTRQWVHKLADDFRLSTGLASWKRPPSFPRRRRSIGFMPMPAGSPRILVLR